MDSSSSGAASTAAAEVEDAVGVTNDLRAASATMSATCGGYTATACGADCGDCGGGGGSGGGEFLEGSLLAAEPVVFRRARSGKRCALSPLLVDFRRLVRGGGGGAAAESLSLIRGVRNVDLLHSVVGLYDVSLDEMTPDVLYETVCEKRARTIALLRDAQDVLEEYETSRRTSSTVADGKRKPEAGTCDARPKQGIVTDSDRYEPGDGLQATFAAAYSDTDSDEEEEEEKEESDERGSSRRAEPSDQSKSVDGEAFAEDDDFSQGIGTFLKAVVERRRRRTTDPSGMPLDRSVLGAEGRLVAALTYEKKYTKSGEKVIHVTLLSVRRRFRGMGVGKYLLQLVKDPAVVGAYDAVVAHVDNSAVDFFGRYGFSDDVVLNSRWRELADQFTNCTLMSHVPPYAGQTFPDKVLDLDLFSMEQDMKKWKEKHLESYQAQVTCVGRMKAEIIRLRAIVSTQQHLIDELQHRVENLQQQQQQQQRRLLLLRPAEMEGSRRGVHSDAEADVGDGGSSGADVADEGHDSGSDIGGSSARHLIEGLEQELRRYRLCGAPLTSDDAYGYSGDGGSCGSLQQLQMRDSPAAHLPSTADYDDELRRYVVARRHDEVYDHGKDIALFHQICEDFMTSMRKDPKIQRPYSITSISKALLQSTVTDRYAAERRNHGDSALTMRAYFCGSQEQPDRLHEIMKGGFSDSDFVNGDYGRGLYFARYASTAAHFSAPGKLIIAEILLGKCETILKKDRKRTHPDHGYDSLLTPGRLLPTKDDGTVIQEYVLFDTAQALPLFQIDYRLTDADS